MESFHTAILNQNFWWLDWVECVRGIHLYALFTLGIVWMTQLTRDLLRLDSSFQLMDWVDKMTADILSLLTQSQFDLVRQIYISKK